MGKRSSKIRTPYYDRYFGQNYYRLLGDNLGEYGRYCISNNYPVQSPIYVPRSCPITLPPTLGNCAQPSLGATLPPLLGQSLPPITTCLPSSLPQALPFPTGLSGNNLGLQSYGQLPLANPLQLGCGTGSIERPVFFPQAQQPLPQLAQPSFALQQQNSVLPLSQPSFAAQPALGFQQPFGAPQSFCTQPQQQNPVLSLSQPSFAAQPALGFQQPFGAPQSFCPQPLQPIVQPTYLPQIQQPIAPSCLPQFTQPPFALIRQSNQPHNTQKRRGSSNSFHSKISSNINSKLQKIIHVFGRQKQHISYKKFCK